MTITYRIECPRAEFVVGEDVIVGLALENHALTPARVPDPESNLSDQPSYTLVGDDPDAATTTDLRARVWARTPAGPPGRDPGSLTLPPGGRWRGHALLHSLFRLDRPGRYVLRSRLRHGDHDAEAPPVAFTLEPLRVVGASVGVDGAPPGAPLALHAAWLHHPRGAPSGALFLARFGEQPAADPVPVRRGVRRKYDVAAGATDVLVAAAEHARLGGPFHWVAWREGATLLALASGHPEPARLDLEGDPAAVARPAFMSSARDLDVFVVGRSRAGPSLTMARFRDAGPGRAPTGAVRWSGALPAATTHATAAVEPGSDGARHHLAFVATTLRGAWLFHGTAGPARPLEVRPLGGWDDAAPVDDAPPALFVEPRGTARVGFVATRADDPRRGVLIEATTDAQPPRETALPALPSLVVAARVGYARGPDGEVRCSVVVRTQDGDLHAWHPGASVRVVRRRVDPALPLEVVVLGTRRYLLEPSPAGGLALHPW